MTEPIINKKCSRCKRVKPLTEFRGNTAGTYGRQAYCKKCQVEYIRPRAQRTRQRLMARLHIEIPDEQRCRGCTMIKPAGAFHSNRSQPSGLAAYCKMCKKIKARDSRLKTLFQISGDAGYRELLAAQGGACGICGKTAPQKKPFHIDHDHITGEIRGILCKVCNTALGMLGDNRAGVERALHYLRR